MTRPLPQRDVVARATRGGAPRLTNAQRKALASIQDENLKRVLGELLIASEYNQQNFETLEQWFPAGAKLPISAQGDLITGDESGAVDVLPVGEDGQVLTVDSTAADGISWKAPAAPALEYLGPVKHALTTNEAGAHALVMPEGAKGLIGFSTAAPGFLSNTSTLNGRKLSFASSFIFSVNHSPGKFQVFGWRPGGTELVLIENESKAIQVSLYWVFSEWASVSSRLLGTVEKGEGESLQVESEESYSASALLLMLTGKEAGPSFELTQPPATGEVYRPNANLEARWYAVPTFLETAKASATARSLGECERPVMLGCALIF